MKSQHFLLVMAALTVAAIIAVPFMGGRSESGQPSAKLPMGLLLESKQGELRIVNTHKDSALFGLQPGDVIKQVDDKPVNSLASFEGILRSKVRGDSIRMVVQRGDALVTINRKYKGPITVEVPANDVKIASSVVPTSNSNDPTTVLPGKPRMINPVWADFGLEFTEGNGRLIVENVREDNAGAAYGIQPQDIVFQVDDHKITSLSDFHGLAAEKHDGDTANVMLVRDDNIVIIKDMQLGGATRKVVAHDGFAPIVYPFASLEKTSLERLLADPFSFVPDAIAKAPVQDAVIANLAEAVVEAEEVLTELDITGNTATVPGYAQTSPIASGVAEVASSVLDLGDTAQLKRFSALDEVNALAADTRNLAKPNAVPRFNKYSDITLPQTEYGKQLAKATAGRKAIENTIKSADAVIDAVINDTPTNVTGTEVDLPQLVESGTSEAGAITGTIPAQEAAQQVVTPSTTSSNVVTSPKVTGSSVSTTPVQRGIIDPPTPPIDNPYVDSTATTSVDVSTSAPTARRVNTSLPEAVSEKREVLKDSDFTSKFTATETTGEAAAEATEAVTEATSPVVESAEAAKTPAEATVVGSSTMAPVEVFSPSAPIMASPMAGMACPQCSPSPYTCGGAAQMDCGCWRCMLSDLADFNLNQAVYGCDTPAVSLGGWFQFGYHSEGNDLFNSRPDNLALHQGWLFIEKAVSENGEWGFRGDIMYGIDADDTQAFGNTPGRWDFQNGFDHGSYGWAIPQLYANVMLGGWDIKIGHFYTLVGYEVVTAPDNFFYSHAITMYNSEPFTHTGVVGSKDISDKTTVYAGWTLGWDTGFDQFNDGSSWLGGLSHAFTDNASITYISTAGNFGARGDDAYSHSIVMNVQVTDSFEWVGQSDMVRVDGTGEDNFGLNQYFLYSATERLGLGARLEWWKGDVLTGYAPHGGVLPAAGSLSYYAATFGLNYKPKSNVIVRPEVRIDWSPAADYDEAYFGVDAIMTF